MNSQPSRSPAQIYAIGVCYTAVLVFTLSAGMTLFSALRWAAPDFMSTKLVDARQMAADNPVAACLLEVGQPCNEFSPEEIREQRERMARYVKFQQEGERVGGRRATIGWALTLLGSGLLWLVHWRILTGRSWK